MGFIFGGNTGMSYDDIQAKRKIAEQLLQQNASTPRNVGEGLSAIGRALAYRNITKKADAADATNKAAFDQQYSGLFAGGGPSGGSGASVPAYVPPDPNSPSQLGHDTMVALGKAPAVPTKDEISSYIATKAKEMGIDPSVAVAVANSEGLNANPNEAWQSGVVKNGQREPSYGPFQLYMGGGLGNSFLKQTGLDPRDPTTWKNQVDYALGHAKQNGWGAWYGARNSGIGDWQGIGGAQGGQPQSGSGMSIQALAEVAGSPYATPGQKAVAAALLQQQMDAADPAKKLALEKAQLEIDKLKNPAAAGSPEYGLNPIVTQDPVTKQYHLFQIPKDGGKPKEVELPYGWTPQQQYLDTGTGFVPVPKQGTAATAEPIVTKDVAGKAAETAVGEAAGAAQVALPGAAQAAADVAAQVESLKNDEYLPNMLGPVDSLLPNVSEDAARVQGKMNQIQGGAFLQARQLLKGGGAITDYEGQKAEAAFARLAAAQNPEDYKAALDEFNYFVQQGLKKLEAQAAMTSKPQDAPSGSTYTFNPETGELE